MGKRAALVQNEHIHVRLRPDLKQRLDIILTSELEGRIPKGAHKAFIEARLIEYFDWKRIDMTPYGFPEGYFITAPAAMADALINRLLEL